MTIRKLRSLVISLQYETNATVCTSAHETSGALRKVLESIDSIILEEEIQQPAARKGRGERGDSMKISQHRTCSLYANHKKLESGEVVYGKLIESGGRNG